MYLDKEDKKKIRRGEKLYVPEAIEYAGIKFFVARKDSAFLIMDAKIKETGEEFGYGWYNSTRYRDIYRFVIFNCCSLMLASLGKILEDEPSINEIKEMYDSKYPLDKNLTAEIVELANHPTRTYEDTKSLVKTIKDILITMGFDVKLELYENYDEARSLIEDKTSKYYNPDITRDVKTK